jgi:hypothetical protein
MVPWSPLSIRAMPPDSGSRNDYGPRSTPWLGELVRREQPWLESSRARGIDPTLHPTISLASMAEYYSAPY